MPERAFGNAISGESCRAGNLKHNIRSLQSVTIHRNKNLSVYLYSW